MIDDDDVWFVAWLTDGIPGPTGIVIFVVAVSVTAYFACSNTDECEKRTCPNKAHAELLEGRCVCAQDAK